MFEIVKVFSATMARERVRLGADVTIWLSDNEDLEVVDTVVKQSSDQAFHCLSIVLFLKRRSQ